MCDGERAKSGERVRKEKMNKKPHGVVPDQKMFYFSAQSGTGFFFMFLDVAANAVASHFCHRTILHGTQHVAHTHSSYSTPTMLNGLLAFWLFFFITSQSKLAGSLLLQAFLIDPNSAIGVLLLTRLTN